MAKGSNLVDETPSGPPNRHPKSSALLDLSNFDINAVLRGMQLTLVGGTFNTYEKERIRTPIPVY